MAKGKKAIRLLLPGKTETYVDVAVIWRVEVAKSYTHVGRVVAPRTAAKNTVGACSRPWGGAGWTFDIEVISIPESVQSTVSLIDMLIGHSPLPVLIDWIQTYQDEGKILDLLTQLQQADQLPQFYLSLPPEDSPERALITTYLQAWEKNTPNFS